jgi:peptidoglycan/LPS O-acetylase OafA/YrhL
MTHSAAPIDVRRRTELKSLTGLRGLAALCVFFLHFAAESVFASHRVNLGLVRLTAGPAQAAVSFFFLLSGFVLVWVSRPGDTAWLFWHRRALKIYPNHLVTWVAGLILMILVGGLGGGWRMLPSLALLQVWFPDEKVILGTDGPAWSLSCELFFYALFPLLLVWTSRIRRELLWPAAFGVGGLLIVITVIVGFAVPIRPQAAGLSLSLYQFYVLVMLPPIRLLDFVLGMLVARIVLTDQWPAVRWRWIGLALAAGWVLSLALPAPQGLIAPFLPANLLLLGTAATHDIAGLPTLFSGRAMIWLGNVSFAFYLIHWLVLHYGRIVLGGGPWGLGPALAFMTGTLVVALALAHPLNTRLEIPIVRRWGASRGAVQPDSSASDAAPVRA